MIILLLVLVGLGIILSLVLLFSPSGDNGVKNQKYFQGVVVGELRQLKEEISSLTGQIKNLGVRQAEINKEVFSLKQKDTPHEITPFDEYSLPAEDSDLSMLKEENKNLAKKILDLTSENIKIKDSYKQQEKIIHHLHENENNLREELDASKRRELRLAKNFNKQEEICANLEQELDALRARK